MKNAVRTCLFAAVVCFASTITSSARAEFPGHGLGSFSSWGHYGPSVYGWANRQTLPYYAVHPPVYYSYSVPRPYGYSPYALPPGVEPAELKAAPQPEEIINPYFRPKNDSDDEGANEETLSPNVASQMIVNPFYRPSRPVSDSKSTIIR